MMQPSNTPPDGDFVRYVECLTAAQAVVPGAQHKPFQPGGFFRQLGALARRAAEEARKIPSTLPKK